MKSIELLKSRIFGVDRLTYVTASGASVSRDVIRHPGSVAVVPVLADGRICLIKNHRVSVDATLIEIPAGTMEPPEAALDCAHRELQEETGYAASKISEMCSFFPAPGILDEQMHLFLAEGLTPGDPAREQGEEIENLIVTLADAKTMISDGRICDAKTMIGLLLFERTLEANQ